ncbi:MAG: aspartate kinase [Chitinophagaceae bacterium]|nr:aspartate kinase [Chitinophagaceae bacterium]
MKVFKFGGASIETCERAKNVVNIIRDHAEQPILVVISAKGKTTNALEKIVDAYYAKENDKAVLGLEEIVQSHNAYALELLKNDQHPVFDKLRELYTEIEWVLTEPYGRPYDYYYDQIVSIGELLSTSILHAFIQQEGLNAAWLDVRDVLKTDDTYRDANIEWASTENLIQAYCNKTFHTHQIIITQGFIGSTEENNTVTLGREGSDYTAAVFANVLDAESLSIWKDVPSLLNADPKIFPNTLAIPEITFHEVIEMAFYGAQVIHPKTIKPLQNKSIPLYVRCFLDPSLPGTLIHHSDKAIAYPPIMVLKKEQVLLQVNTRDYSFITEDNLSKIYTLFHECKVKINLIQNAAISFVACIDANIEKMEKLILRLQETYDVKRNEHLFLFTVRHYTDEVLNEELKHRTILLSQKTRQTIQIIAQ